MRSSRCGARRRRATFEREPEELAIGAIYSVSGFELASRLSFFLWSSIPDDELLALAADGRLADPEVLAAQVARMLADERSAALVDNFASQWLLLRELDTVVPEDAAFDDELRAAMRAADDYGKGIHTRTQMFYASMSYWFHADEARRAAGPLLADEDARVDERVDERAVGAGTPGRRSELQYWPAPSNEPPVALPTAQGVDAHPERGGRQAPAHAGVLQKGGWRRERDHEHQADSCFH